MRSLPAFYGFTDHVAITPSNSEVPDQGIHALYIAASGNLVLRARDSATEITYAVTAGDIIPCISPRLIGASTTATVIGWKH